MISSPPGSRLVGPASKALPYAFADPVVPVPRRRRTAGRSGGRGAADGGDVSARAHVSRRDRSIRHGAAQSRHRDARLGLDLGLQLERRHHPRLQPHPSFRDGHRRLWRYSFPARRGPGLVGGRRPEDSRLGLPVAVFPRDRGDESGLLQGPPGGREHRRRADGDGPCRLSPLHLSGRCEGPCPHRSRPRHLQ
jgi:hypothetical protein